MYIYSMKNKLLEELISNYNSLKKVILLKDKYLKKYNKLSFFKKIINYSVKKNINNLESLALECNEKFIENEMLKYQELFKNIGGHELDNNQKEAIIKNPTNLLIVAGAGSGKTLTLVGKVLYLIEKGVNSNKILCLSFTNESAQSLKNKLLKSNVDIDVMTFHKLGIETLKRNGKKINIANENILNNIVEKHSIDFSFLLNFYSVDEFGNETKTPFSIKEELLKNSEVVNDKKIVVKSFINLFKSNGYEHYRFKYIYKKINKEEKCLQKYYKKIIKICEKVYLEYEENLKMKNLIDFNDMIFEAMKENKYKKYDYILVDEFQDTSKIKCLFLKKVQKVTNAKIVAVGDDWQSIYHFTGCTLSNFVNFCKIFEDAEVVFLQNTYRNSQELINITSDFVTKNAYQIKKKIKSVKTNRKPIKIYYYEGNYLKILCKVLNSINKKNVLILCRNNKEVINCKKIIGQRANVMTAHKAKGLESDEVIIVKLDDTNSSFPSKKKYDEILKYVLEKEEKFLYAEERRLFYVALTRTKNNVHLLVNKENPSIFIEEIVKKYSKFIEFKNLF